MGELDAQHTHPSPSPQQSCLEPRQGCWQGPQVANSNGKGPGAWQAQGRSCEPQGQQSQEGSGRGQPILTLTSPRGEGHWPACGDPLPSLRALPSTRKVLGKAIPLQGLSGKLLLKGPPSAALAPSPRQGAQLSPKMGSLYVELPGPAAPHRDRGACLPLKQPLQTQPSTGAVLHPSAPPRALAIASASRKGGGVSLPVPRRPGPGGLYPC